MASKITMPKLSDTMERGILLKWLKKEGDRVEPGDALAEVETDKANMELEVFEEGVIRKLFGAEGDGIAIGTVVGILAEDEDEDISDLLAEVSSGGSGGDAAPAAAPSDDAAEAKDERAAAAGGATGVGGGKSADGGSFGVGGGKAAPPPPPEAASGRVLASPVARRIAEERGLDLGSIRGSGPSGRIIKRDVVNAPAPSAAPAPAAAAAAPAAKKGPPPRAVAEFSVGADDGPGYEEIQQTNLRQIISRRMGESKFSAPHFYVTMDVDMKAAMEMRSQLKASGAAFSYNDLVLKAIAGALVRVPAMNGTYADGVVRRYQDAHVGFAVAFEGGLITPVVRYANRKSLGQIASETKDLVARARQRKLKPDEYTGGTFTVSNLGMFGVEEFTAILNTPEIGILAVGGIRSEPVVEDGAVVPGHRMKVTVSTDHRAADGADAASLLKEFKALLETPSLLIW